MSKAIPDDFIGQYQVRRSEPHASAQNRSNVQNWLKSHDGAISPDESTFIDGNSDLFSIAATVRTPLKSAVEKSKFFVGSKYLRRSCPIPEGESTYPYDPRTTIYQADERIDFLVNIVICIVGFLMLVVPLWILIFVHSRRFQLAVITICVALFLAIVQSVVVARPFDSLAATAA